MSKFKDLILETLQENALNDLYTVNDAKELYKDCIQAVKEDPSIIDYIHNEKMWISPQIESDYYPFYLKPLYFALEFTPDGHYSARYNYSENIISINVGRCIRHIPEFYNKYNKDKPSNMEELLKILNHSYVISMFIHEYQHMVSNIIKEIPRPESYYRPEDDKQTYIAKYRNQPDEHNSFMLQDFYKYDNMFEQYIKPDMSKEEKVSILNNFINNIKTVLDKSMKIQNRYYNPSPQYRYLVNNQHKIKRYFNRLYNYLYIKYVVHEFDRDDYVKDL